MNALKDDDELTSALRQLALSRDETHGVRAQAEKAATERDAAESAARELYELADDLRTYTREWDWKYGEAWDEVLARHAAYGSGR